MTRKDDKRDHPSGGETTWTNTGATPYFSTRFNKIATQGAPQMAVDKEANSLSRVYSYYSKFNLRFFLCVARLS